MSTLVIIPTFNERENIPPLVTQILQLPGNLRVLIVDDNSPDGTAEVVTSSFQNEDRVHLLKRERKLGLGTAYSAGFDYALKNNYDIAISMDADFSHDPKHLPELLNVAKKYDMVIGSRYIPGGKTVNWGISRKFISRTANLLAHHIISLKPADCTSGLRLFHADTLRKLDFESIQADGYSYHLEVLKRASDQHMKIGEIPITFTDRLRGKSKVSSIEIFKALHTVFRLRFRPTLKPPTIYDRSNSI
jgi:dolichol-phosphate mannosyltransferase